MMRVICVAIIFLSSQLSFLSYPTTIRSYRLVKQNIKQQQLYQTSQTYSDDNILTIANDNISTATISGLIYTNEGISSSSSASSIVKFLRKLTYFKVCPLSDKEKQGLFEDFSSMANTLSFQDISNCIWNLGLIGFKINILSNHSSVTPVIAAIRLSVESLEEEEEVDELRPQPILPPSHSLLRLVGGLEKIGIPWIDFPPALRQRYLGTLNTKMTDEALGREVATLIWTLGRLGALLSELPQDDQVTLWRRIYLVTLSSSLTPQGLAMMTNGLAKLGARWDLIEENIRSRLALKIAECDLNAGETCSVITALASMGAAWSSLELDTTESLLRNICKYAPDLNGREVSNIFWSLGQLRLNFGEMIRPIEAEPGSLELDEDWLIEEQELYTALEASLCECVRKRASSFIAYDLESTLSGLAHTSVNKLQLATVLLELTPNLIARLSDKTVNSFFFVNVMSSLSLMPVRLAIYTIVGQTDATLCLNATLEATLVDYALQKFHVFNGRQFPTLLMSLSRLGLSVNRLSSFQQGRLTAVLSRILMSLDAEGMVASLLALQRMGFSWRDHFVSPSQSQSNSPVTTEALGGRVLAYVRSNIGSFREVDISLLIFALGRLGLDWGTVDGAFERKVSNRLARIARFLPLTRAALTIQGLELMKVKWTNLSANITQSLDAALPVIISGSTAKDQVDLAVLLRSSQAIKYVDMVAILQSTNISSKLQEPVDQSFVATHTCSTVDFHMEGLLRRYSTQTS